MRGIIWLLSHDEVNQDVAHRLGSERGLAVQVRHLKEGLPDGDCRALVVDLDSVAPDRRALQRLVKELSGRPHDYPVAAFGYHLGEDQVRDLRVAGVEVFEHGLGPVWFTAIIPLAAEAPPGDT